MAAARGRPRPEVGAETGIGGTGSGIRTRISSSPVGHDRHRLPPRGDDPSRSRESGYEPSRRATREESGSRPYQTGHYQLGERFRGSAAVAAHRRRRDHLNGVAAAVAAGEQRGGAVPDPVGT